MCKKLLIWGLCGLLSGGIFSWAQEAQQADTQQQDTRRGNRSNFGRQRPDRGSREGGMPGQTLGERPSRSDRPAGPPPGADDEPPPPDMGEATPDVGLEEVKEEDDTKNPLYGNPYRVIVQRNLFSLKPALALGAAVTNVVPMALNTNNLKFMGITTIGGIIKSHFMITKPGQQPPQQYISLTEGQASDGLECVSIQPDPNDPTAEVRADGKQIKVSFATHGIMAGAGAVAANNRAQQQAGQRPQNQDPRQRGPQRGVFQGQQQIQGNNAQQAAGGFNLPAVNAATRANTPPVPSPGTYTGWRPSGTTGSTSTSGSRSGVSSGGTSGMPMTSEASRYRSRRSVNLATPPMPPSL